MPRIDREAPLRFLRTAFQPDDWVAIFLKSYDTGRVSQRVGPVSWVMDPRFQAWLRFKNARRFNVYVSVNAVAAGRGSRTREAIGAVRHVFLEVDHDGPGVLARVRSRSDLPEPSYVLHSSPNRVHVLWRGTDFSTDHVELLQKHLATELDTDRAATPPSQMTRLVGFNNYKYARPYLVTIDYRDVDRTFTPLDFPAPTRSRKALEPSPSAAHGRTSAMSPIERARRYLARVPPAIAGEHGDLRTFRVCCRLVRGFALDDDATLAVMADWNTQCQPPWNERELRDKLRRARRYGREPVAGLLSQEM
ncbi:MAG: DNA-primase RepB domain-containing protein [Vicinamibacteraceae bacterium]